MKTRHLMILAFLAATAACGPLLPHGPKPSRMFSLSADIPAATTALPYSLQVQQPSAAPGLDSERIALKKSQHELDYYAGAKWAGNLPDVMRDAVIDALDRAHVVKTVGPDTLSFAADYRLAIDITHIPAEYQGATATDVPEVRVRIVARLLQGSGGTIIASECIEQTARAASNTMEHVIAAENLAFDAVVEQLAIKIQAHLNAVK